MGLFNFGKKKELDSDMPPKMEASSMTNAGLADAPLPPPELNEPPRMEEPRNIPAPPSAMSNAPAQSPPDDFSSFPDQINSESTMPEPMKNMEPLESFDQPEIPAESPFSSDIEEKPKEESFELPDFDDEEIEEIESLSKEDEEQVFEPEPEPEPAVEKELEPIVEPEVKPESVKQEVKKTIPPKQVKPISYPKEIRAEVKEKYTSLNNYVSIKDELNQAIKNIRSTETLMINHNNTVQAKSDKYKKMSSTLNELQDKMMIIDNKLFE